MAIKAKELNVNIPWVGSISFIADEVQQRAAWALYVELQTRVAVQPLSEAGPEVADGESSFGPIAIRVQSTWT